MTSRAPDSDGVVLSLRDVAKSFGGIRALDGLDLDVARGEIVGVIGPNGAGKTSLFDVMSGLQHPDTGKITFAGTRIERLPAHRIARLGLARTMQAAGVFVDLTVMENLRLAATWTPVRGRTFVDRAEMLLEQTRLTAHATIAAGRLSYGQQRLVEFAMAVMGRPSLVLLDEPAAGVNPVLIDRITELILTVHEEGTTFMIVEHNVPFVMGVSTRMVAMAQGRKIADGSVEQVRNDPLVLEHYLSGG